MPPMYKQSSIPTVTWPEPKLPKHPFDYHRPNPTQIENIDTIRKGCKGLFMLLESMYKRGEITAPEFTLAKRKLEEFSMWANKGVVLSDEGEVVPG